MQVGKKSEYIKLMANMWTILKMKTLFETSGSIALLVEFKRFFVPNLASNYSHVFLQIVRLDFSLFNLDTPEHHINMSVRV